MKRETRIIFRRLLIILLIITLGYFASRLTPQYSTNLLQTQKIATITNFVTSSAVPSNRANEEILVKRVIDGDTIELIDGRRVRYIGMNTPETVDPRKPVECFGHEASVENKQLVEGKIVRLEKDVSETDKYGRLLRFVYIGDIMVNDYLLRQGFARVETIPPDVRNEDQFISAEKEARENNRGLWSGCP